MRTIKFRAFDGYNMIYSQDEYRTTQSMLTAGDILKRYDTVMQFIGLHDKNGKEIYKGDFISERGSKPYEVIWQAHSVQWIMQSVLEGRGYRQMAMDYAARDYEIIGNIYEHPELFENTPAEPQMKTR